MSDVSKAQKLKLANSRKRFKELQELKKKKDASQSGGHTPENSHTPINSMTSSTHSSSNGSHGENYMETVSVAQLPNYFNISNNLDAIQQQPALFFENFSQNNSNDNNQNSEVTTTNNMFNYFNQSSVQNNFENMVSNIVDSPKVADVDVQPRYGENYSLFSQNNQHSYVQETRDIINRNNDDLSLDDPELKQNDLYEMHKTVDGHEVGEKISDDQDDVSVDYPELRTESSSNNDIGGHDLFSTQSTQNLLDYLQVHNSESISEAENLEIKKEITQTSNDAQAAIISNSGNVQRVSSAQMGECLDNNSYNTSSHPMTDLEKRNLELVSLLEQEKLKSEQQQNIIDNLQSTIIIADSNKSKTESDYAGTVTLTNEIKRLQDELQCHVQTVTMLVNEKSELANMVAQLEASLKQKNTESEELQARLKTSRSRVADLECEVNNLKCERVAFEEASQQQNKVIVTLREEYSQIRDQKEELFQDLLEARERYKTVIEENTKLQQHNQELSSNLSLAQIKIQQITNGEAQSIDSHLEKILQDKQELEKQYMSMNVTLKTLTKEREESNIHYQQYAQQLNEQLNSMSTRIEQLQEENERLANQEQNRIRHIGELERQLQFYQNEHKVGLSMNNSNSCGNDVEQLRLELETAKEVIAKLENDITNTKENYTRTCNERDMLTRELEAKNESISELEIEVERLRGNQPDSAKLLATMESDKVAAAAAVRQNMEMKQQVEGMKEVIAKMDNDKVDLTEKLTFEMSSNKDLLDKLQKTELQLQRLTDAIEIKDRELSNLRENSEEFDKHMLQHEQLDDRLRHYEAQDRSLHILQNELQASKMQIVKLQNEIETLRREKQVEKNEAPLVEINDDNNSSSELDVLRNKIEEMERRNVELETNSASINNSTNDDVAQVMENNTQNTVLLDREEAMKHLEVKFQKTMQDIADLTEEKQRLEHLVLQLQGETETIGEYVALYQQQRMMLKQKTMEKDQQLKQLASDREQMKAKLEKLNDLIRKLVVEKGSIPKELLKHHEHLTSQSDNFCEAHTKIHEEINKLNDNDALVAGAADDVNVVNGNNSQTAEEIIALLSEIKSSNLVEPNSIHHCAWCSGQLMTV